MLTQFIINENFITVTNFKIFNKWGQLVYDNTAKPGWNGSFDGALQPAGGYVYVLEYKEKNGDTQQVSGDVVLIR